MEINISYKQDAPQTLAFAAGELKDYLNRMLPEESGSVAIRLHVQAEEPTAHDAFAIDIAPNGGSIEGNRARAVLLGVYELLHSLGCHFLAPGREHELVPRISREALQLRCQKTAAFYHRGVCIEGADSRENIRDFIDWLPKVGFNAFFFQFKTPYTFLARWYRHERNPYAEPEKYELADAERDTAMLEQEIRKRGLLLHKVGHGWTGEVLGYDSVSWNMDSRPLDLNKVPLAARINGRRELWQGVPLNTNLCYSDPQAAEAFVSLVVDYAKSHPEVDYLHIWLADEYNNICECERCRGELLSDQYVRLLNAIDRRLTKAGLDTKLVFLLYQELLWPPERERLEHPERFVLMFAPISRTFSEPYTLDGRYASIPAYHRNRITLPTDLLENLAFLEGWQKQFSGDSFVYDYPLGRAHYGDFGYCHIARVIWEDIGQLKKMGLNGYISCQELRAGMPNFLPNYVMGRRLFDEDLSFETLAEEYYRAAYGPRWELAKDCLSRLSDLQVCDYLNGKGPRQSPAMAERLTQIENICTRYLSWPEGRSTAEHSLQEGFWRRLSCHLEHVSLLAHAMACLARGEKESRSSWLTFRDTICRREPQLQLWLDGYRVLEVTEKYTGFCTAEQEE